MSIWISEKLEELIFFLKQFRNVVCYYKTVRGFIFYENKETLLRNNKHITRGGF